MEILVEILLEFIVQFFGEFLLQMLWQLFVEVGLQSLAEPFRRQPKPLLAVLGYTVFGAVVGGLSLLVFPDFLMAAKGLRMANVVLSPIVAGLSMAALGKWRERRGQAVLRIDKFWYGYLFALAFGLIRFWFAK